MNIASSPARAKLSRALSLIAMCGLSAPVFAAESDVLSAPSISLGDAIEATLARQPGVEITRQQVLQRKGNLQSASGQFDWVLGSFYSKEVERTPIVTPPGAPPPLLSVHRQDIAVYSVGISKQFRSGFTVTPQVTVVDASDNTSGPGSVSQSNLALKFTVPLLRGFGPKATAAQENAARSAAQAQEQLARFQVEQLVYQTTASYWNCLAARRDLEILIDVAVRAEKIFKTVETFAKGGELDSATVDQAHALVSSKQGDREQGELSYFQARQALGLALGLGPKELPKVPDVNGEFPTVIDPEQVRGAMGEKYVAEALERRGDYRAAGLNIDAEQALLEQARSDLKPRFDLELSVGYAGYDRRADRFRPAHSVSNELTGVNFLSAFTLEWPLPNNVARGAVVNRRARLEEVKLNATQAGNGIAANVLIALETLRKSISQYRLSTDAVETYRRAISQTGEKLKAGEASLTELIDMEDRYAGARRVQTDSLRKYAVTLAQLRLLTGTLSTEVDHKAIFEVQNLSQVPFQP